MFEVEDMEEKWHLQGNNICTLNTYLSNKVFIQLVCCSGCFKAAHKMKRTNMKWKMNGMTYLMNADLVLC